VIGGLVLVASGAAGAAWAVRAATSRRRPVDLAGALLAPLFVAAACVGGVICFVPGFLR
jgi:hypothetical protein